MDCVWLKRGVPVPVTTGVNHCVRKIYRNPGCFSTNAQLNERGYQKCEVNGRYHCNL
jgi:hypothetical protein